MWFQIAVTVLSKNSNEFICLFCIIVSIRNDVRKCFFQYIDFTIRFRDISSCNVDIKLNSLSMKAMNPIQTRIYCNFCFYLKTLRVSLLHIENNIPMTKAERFKVYFYRTLSTERNLSMLQPQRAFLSCKRPYSY